MDDVDVDSAAAEGLRPLCAPLLVPVLRLSPGPVPTLSFFPPEVGDTTKADNGVSGLHPALIKSSLMLANTLVPIESMLDDVALNSPPALALPEGVVGDTSAAGLDIRRFISLALVGEGDAIVDLKLGEGRVGFDGRRARRDKGGVCVVSGEVGSRGSDGVDAVGGWNRYGDRGPTAGGAWRAAVGVAGDATETPSEWTCKGSG